MAWTVVSSESCKAYLRTTQEACSVAGSFLPSLVFGVRRLKGGCRRLAYGYHIAQIRAEITVYKWAATLSWRGQHSSLFEYSVGTPHYLASGVVSAIHLLSLLFTH
jgi:hypothetical protein